MCYFLKTVQIQIDVHQLYQTFSGILVRGISSYLLVYYNLQFEILETQICKQYFNMNQLTKSKREFTFDNNK